MRTGLLAHVWCPHATLHSSFCIHHFAFSSDRAFIHERVFAGSIRRFAQLGQATLAGCGRRRSRYSDTDWNLLLADARCAESGGHRPHHRSRSLGPAAVLGRAGNRRGVSPDLALHPLQHVWRGREDDQGLGPDDDPRAVDRPGCVDGQRVGGGRDRRAHGAHAVEQAGRAAAVHSGQVSGGDRARAFDVHRAGSADSWRRCRTRSSTKPASRRAPSPRPRSASARCCRWCPGWCWRLWRL